MRDVGAWDRLSTLWPVSYYACDQVGTLNYKELGVAIWARDLPISFERFHEKFLNYEAYLVKKAKDGCMI